MLYTVQRSENCLFHALVTQRYHWTAAALLTRMLSAKEDADGFGANEPLALDLAARILDIGKHMLHLLRLVPSL